MNIFLSPSRVRSIIADAATVPDVVDALRRRRVRYHFSTAGGSLHIRIPYRAGAVVVSRSGSRFTVSVATDARTPFPGVRTI